MVYKVYYMYAYKICNSDQLSADYILYHQYLITLYTHENIRHAYLKLIFVR